MNSKAFTLITTLLLAAACLALPACEDVGTTPHTLVDAEDVAPDPANCPFGGQRLFWGSDVNRNGTLDEDERTNSYVVCNFGRPGDDGLDTLVSTTEIPAGDSVCPQGGFLIESGTDLDRDGVLAGSEITDTEAFCHGDPGLVTLVDIGPLPEPDPDDEDPQELCSDGGYLISSGVDDNRNGALDPEEVDSEDAVCHGRQGYNGIVRTSAVPVGDAECPGGGLLLEYGPDANDSDALDDDEVFEAFTLCSPLGFNALATVVPEPEGDNCAFGGLAVSAGLDNGDGGGTPHDQVLQGGEVDVTEFVCNGPPTDLFEPLPVDPPEGDDGDFVIDTTGGDGCDDDGGAGGNIEIRMDDGSLNGNLVLARTGTVDASWDFPAEINVELGFNPLIVDGSNTQFECADDVCVIPMYHNLIFDPRDDLDEIDPGPGLADQAIVTLPGVPLLLQWFDDLRTFIPVSGLRVEAGITLAFEPNCDGFEYDLCGEGFGSSLPSCGLACVFDLECDSTIVRFFNDVHNLGTITTARPPRPDEDSRQFDDVRCEGEGDDVSCPDLFDCPDEPGDASCHDTPDLGIGFDLFYGEAGSLIDLIGVGGDVLEVAEDDFAVIGAGDGGSLALVGWTAGQTPAPSDDTGAFFNMGDIVTNGGEGYDDPDEDLGGTGGHAGSVDIRALLRLLNSADVTALGGLGHAPISAAPKGGASEGDGGDGGSIHLGARVGHLYTSGDFDTTGGDCIGDETGGDGGDICMNLSQFGRLLSSGAWTAMGGASDADNAGDGGDVFVFARGELRTRTDINTRGGDTEGGDGTFFPDGGDGGDVEIATAGGFFPFNWSGAAIPNGNLMISGSIITQGGHGPPINDDEQCGETTFDEEDGEAKGAFTDGRDEGHGGRGGSVFISMNERVVAAGQELRMYGYGNGFVLDGGDSFCSDDNEAGFDGAAYNCDEDAGEAGHFFGENEGCDDTGTVCERDNGGDSSLSGGIYNFVDVFARGGTAGDGDGGDGGSFELLTDEDGGFQFEQAIAENHGALILDGGDGGGYDLDDKGGESALDETRVGGNGGIVYIYGYTAALNTGDISSVAGDAIEQDDLCVIEENDEEDPDDDTLECNGQTFEEAGGDGGHAALTICFFDDEKGEEISEGAACEALEGDRDYMEGITILSTLGPADNTGIIAADGGDGWGDFDGGSGAFIQIVGDTASNAADVSAVGGDSLDFMADEDDDFEGFGDGGDGGVVMIHGIYGGIVNTAEVIDVAGGVGNDHDGNDGRVYEDGMNVSSDFD